MGDTEEVEVFYQIEQQDDNSHQPIGITETYQPLEQGPDEKQGKQEPQRQVTIGSTSTNEIAPGLCHIEEA